MQTTCGETVGPAPSASSGVWVENKDFLDTLSYDRLRRVREVVGASQRVPEGRCQWPMEEMKLLEMAPELRQLATWCLELGAGHEPTTEDGGTGSEPEQVEGEDEGDGENEEQCLMMRGAAGGGRGGGVPPWRQKHGEDQSQEHRRRAAPRKVQQGKTKRPVQKARPKPRTSSGAKSASRLAATSEGAFMPLEPSISSTTRWWQQTLAYVDEDEEPGTREGLSRAQLRQVEEMLEGLTPQGRANMQAGVLAYLSMVLGDLAVLTREAVCQPVMEAGTMAEGQRESVLRDSDGREVGADEVLVAVAEEEAFDEDGEDTSGERTDNEDHSEDDDNLLMMQVTTAGKASSGPFGPLMEMFVNGLAKYTELERRTVCRRMLVHLRHNFPEPNASSTGTSGCWKRRWWYMRFRARKAPQLLRR